MDPILDVIDEALRRKGLSDAAASRMAVGHPSLLKNLRMPREGEKRYNLPALQKLAEVLDLEFYFGPRRMPLYSGLAESDENDGLPIPWFEPRLGQGSAPVRFSRSWLEASDLQIERLRALVPDEVECPAFLAARCLALLEEPSRPGPEPTWWAFREQTRVVVGRMQRLDEVDVVLPSGIDGGVRAYKRTDLSFRPLGKVVWLSVVRPR